MFSGNIYWTDQGFDVIEVARLNGSFRYVVISAGLDKPRAITVHPVKGCATVTPETLYVVVDVSPQQINIVYLVLRCCRCCFVAAGICSGPSGVSTPASSGLGLDGSQRLVMVNVSISWPNGISIDYQVRSPPPLHTYLNTTDGLA